MAVTNYFTVDGEIIGESTNGVRLDYLTDALGSVTATVDQTGTVQNTYRYKPYGNRLAKTGTSADPDFMWIGSGGYRQTGIVSFDSYVRARHYSSNIGAWGTADPAGYGHGLNLYSYIAGNPISSTDASGLGCQTTGLDKPYGCGTPSTNCDFCTDDQLPVQWQLTETGLNSDLTGCFGKANATLIAGLLACVAEAESGYCNTCKSNTCSGGAGGCGMFIISAPQWKACTPATCSTTQICSAKNNSCAIGTAANMAIALCSSNPSCAGLNIVQCLSKYWGVLPPANQNDKVSTCLQRQGLSFSQFQSIKCPAAVTKGCGDAKCNNFTLELNGRQSQC